MSDYSLVDEGEHSWTIQDSDGNQRAVAKKGTPKDLHEQIMSLPKVAAFEPDSQVTKDKGGDLPNPQMQPILSASRADLADMPKPSPPTLAEPSPIPHSVQEMKALQKSPQIVPPSNPQTPTVQQDSTTAPIGQQQPYGNASYSGLSSNQMPGFGEQARALQMMSGAVGMKGQAESEAANRVALAQQKYMDDMQKAQDDYANRRKAMDDETDRLQADVSNSTIDPNRWWAKQSSGERVGRKILATFGMILGGMAQMRTGVNPAVAMLDKVINDDIDSQKQDMNKKQSLLRTNLDKYGNLTAAENATRLDMMNMLNAQLGKITAQSNAPIAKANAQMAQAQILEKIGELKHGLASQMAFQQLIAGGGQGDQLVAMLPEQQRESLIKVRNPLNPNDQGRWQQAKSPEAAKEVEKIQTSVHTISNLIDEMIAARARHKKDMVGSTSIIPWTQKSEEYNQLHGAAIEELRSLSSGARLTEGTIKYLAQILPNPGSPKTSDDELIRAKNILAQRLGNEMAGRVYGGQVFKPLSNRSQDLRP